MDWRHDSSRLLTWTQETSNDRGRGMANFNFQDPKGFLFPEDCPCYSGYCHCHCIWDGKLPTQHSPLTGRLVDW